jgi:hypothetical protein
VLACALAAFAVVRGSDLVVHVGIRIVAVGIGVLVVALVLGWARLVPLALGLLGGVYALYLAVDDPPLDVSVPVFAAGVLVTAELAYWSLEEREKVPVERGEALRRAAIVAVEGLVALILGGGLLALADVARTRGLAIDLFGAAAAAAALLLLARLARR